MNARIAVSSVLALAFLISVPGLAAAEESNSSSEGGAITSTVKTCMAAAVATREAALQSGWSAFNTAVMNAYDTRADALADAWTGNTRAEIKNDVKAAWKAFKDAMKNARKDWKTAKKNAWSEFKTDAKDCKAPADTLDAKNASTEI
jgi:hypothetical protein